MPDDVTPVPDGETVDTLRAAVVVLARRLRHQLTESELSATDMAVLGRVFREGPLTPGALARAEHVQPPSMTRVIERLEARGYLLRNPDPTDGRRILVTRTELGEKFIDEARLLRSAWLAGQLDKLGQADRLALAAAADAFRRLAELP